MSNLIQDLTLNEKDSIQDMLNLEKTMVKLYATAYTEGVSDNFRKMVKCHLDQTASDQMSVFLQMTDRGYYQVESVPQSELSKEKEKFCAIKDQLS